MVSQIRRGNNKYKKKNNFTISEWSTEIGVLKLTSQAQSQIVLKKIPNYNSISLKIKEHSKYEKLANRTTLIKTWKSKERKWNLFIKK